MSSRSSSEWQERFRAPTLTLPEWSRRAPDRAVLTSDETGSFQAYAWDVRSGERHRVTDEHVGVIHATISADGREAIWFSDPTGDESGRWMEIPFGGGEPRAILPGAPVGWPDGLAVGLRVVAGVLADRDGFAVYVARNGEAAKEILRDVDALSIGGTDFHVEGFQVGGLSADEDLLCITAAQDGDNIHRKLLVLDPLTGAVVGELADGPGFGVDAFAWSPVPGDRRLLAAHEREDLMRALIWDLAAGERTDLRVDLPGEVIPAAWWPDGRPVLVGNLFRGRPQLYRYEL